MTPAQCRAARALLEWSQEALAEETEVSVAALRNFERSRSALARNNAKAVQAAFERAGIEFIPGGVRKLA